MARTVGPTFHLPFVDRQKFRKILNRVRVHAVLGRLTDRLNQTSLNLRGVVSKTIPAIRQYIRDPVVAVGFHRDHLLDVLLAVDRAGQPVEHDSDRRIMAANQAGGTHQRRCHRAGTLDRSALAVLAVAGDAQ